MTDEAFGKILTIVVTVAVTFLINRFMAYIFNSNEKLVRFIKKKKNEPFEKLEEKDKTIEERIQEIKDDQELIKTALLSSMRVDLLNEIEQATKAGYISAYAKNALVQQHDAYKKLGGNSFIDILWDNFEKIEVISNEIMPHTKDD